MEENIKFVRGRFPDARAFKYAKLSICIWSDMLDRRLSGYFHTEEEAWKDARAWIEKKSYEAIKK